MKTRPFLQRAASLPEKWGEEEFPFQLPAFTEGLSVHFDSWVTFLVGPNGSGKSTFLEAIADLCGFNLAGGNRNHTFESDDASSRLADAMRLSWLPKVTEGFFLRSETFFNFASYIEGMGSARDFCWNENQQGIHNQSHGQFFLAMFKNRMARGIYLLDEPEAALSPSSQLAFLATMNRLERTGKAQFIIATHSPILICYPGATVLQFSEAGIHAVDYQETEHYQITKSFLNDPERYFRHLFED